MCSQAGPTSIFAGGLKFSNGMLVRETTLEALEALTARIHRQARGGQDDDQAAAAVEPVQVDDRGLPVHMDVDEELGSPSGVERTDAFQVHVSEASNNAQSAEQRPSERPGIHGANGSNAAPAERRDPPSMPVSNAAEL